MLKQNGPGNACCCQCTISPNFDDWIVESGTWTRASTTTSWSASSTDDNAELVSNKAWTFGWILGSLRIIPGQYCGWSHAGFRNADGTNRIYVAYRRSPGSISWLKHEVQIIERDAGVDTTLYSWELDNDSGFAVLGGMFWRDEDNSQFVLIHIINGLDPIRVSTSVSVDRMFVRTGTATGFCTKVEFAQYSDVTSPGNLFRYCMNEQVHRAPAEFEVTISGVTAGTSANGGYYSWFNDTFVLSVTTDLVYCNLGGPIVGVLPGGKYYSFSYTHPNYGFICLVMEIGWDATDCTNKMVLWISISDPYETVVAPVLGDDYFQCIRFGTEFTRNCLFDWRKYDNCGSYYYADDDEGSCYLDYQASRTSTIGFPANVTVCRTEDSDKIASSWGAATDAADFSAATVHILAIP